MLNSVMLVLLAGAMNGSFAVPMRFVKGWQWVRTWLFWSLLAMVVFPCAVALQSMPHLAAVYRNAGTHALMLTGAFGMLWGAGTALFGLGISRVGVAISFGIVLGTSSACGAIAPLLLLHRAAAGRSAATAMLVGIALILAGVAATSRAGHLRERLSDRPRERGSFAAGVAICALAGLTSSCMSIALNFSTPIAAAAESMGASRTTSLNAVWPVLLGGGFIVNAVYCIIQIFRNRGAAAREGSHCTNILWVILMAALWAGSNYVYGGGARNLGPLGLILGWPVYMATIVIVANAWGVATGEWRNSDRRAAVWAVTGCLILISGIWTIAAAGTT